MDDGPNPAANKFWSPREFVGSPIWAAAIPPFAIVRALLTVVGIITAYYIMPLMDP